MISESNTQQTRKSFSDKWNNNQSLAFSETVRDGSDIQNWILGRNGWSTANGLRQYLDKKTRVLDAGCGNGRVTNLLRACSDPATTEIVGCDLVAADVAKENLAGLANVKIFDADLTEVLGNLGTFDFIYCQEVLHHTRDPLLGFSRLAKQLRPGGAIAIYVYKRKAPMREHADDFVRKLMSEMEYEKAMEACRQLTDLGRALCQVGEKVTVPAVPILGIEEGTYDVQRFLYHFFLKCFWNDSMSYEENVAINYDWYHPQICERYSIDEVRPWFGQNGLKIEFEHVDHYGITIRGFRPS